MQFCKLSYPVVNKIGFVAVQHYFPTQTHYTNQMKQERRQEKWPNKSRHSFTPTKGRSCGMKLEGVSMTTTYFLNNY